MIYVFATRNKSGAIEVSDQTTKQVYGVVDNESEIVDLVREKTGDLDVQYIFQ